MTSYSKPHQKSHNNMYLVVLPTCCHGDNVGKCYPPVTFSCYRNSLINRIKIHSDKIIALNLLLLRRKHLKLVHLSLQWRWPFCKRHMGGATQAKTAVFPGIGSKGASKGCLRNRYNVTGQQKVANALLLCSALPVADSAKKPSRQGWSGSGLYPERCRRFIKPNEILQPLGGMLTQKPLAVRSE